MLANLRLSLLVLLGIGLLFVPVRAQASPSFMGLGDLPGDQFESVAFGVSADGTAVVGYSYSADGIEAFRWTENGGMVGLGDLPGGDVQSVAYGVSGDGGVVAGIAHTDAGSAGFRWTA